VQTGSLGFRIVSGVPRPDPALVDRFRGLSSSNLADAMGRFRFMDPAIQARTGLPVCGVAVTVNARPGDNLMVHKALELAQPADVVVVSTNGNLVNAVFGEIMGHVATAARLGGIVVDGAIRDTEALTRLELPVFSRTVSPDACDKDGPGEINVPICCGNTVVMPGGIIVGDRDGVVAVPRGDATDALERVARILDRERQWIAAIHQGDVFASEINATLRERGVLPEEP
jgi:regulator of RNase E activity RraA